MEKAESSFSEILLYTTIMNQRRSDLLLFKANIERDIDSYTAIPKIDRYMSYIPLYTTVVS